MNFRCAGDKLPPRAIILSELPAGRKQSVTVRYDFQGDHIRSVLGQNKSFINGGAPTDQIMRHTLSQTIR